MSNSLILVDEHFESRKNWRATTYTIVICGVLLAFFVLYKWPLGLLNVPPTEEGIEVNLGNSDQGFGNDQPLLPGKPSPSNQQAYVPPKAVAAKEEPVKNIATDDKDPDAPEIKKPVVTKPEATKVPEKEIVKNTPVKKSPPVANPVPPVPHPKAVFKGVNGDGTGGNEADSYKKGGNQGIAGGNGDQGKTAGNPTSTNYDGPGGNGNSGVRISRGLNGRNIVKYPTFEDDFNENAKVAVDITVDATGRVASASYQPRGSTTSNNAYRDIALNKARQLRFNSSAQESTGTIVFNFKLRN